MIDLEKLDALHAGANADKNSVYKGAHWLLSINSAWPALRARIAELEAQVKEARDATARLQEALQMVADCSVVDVDPRLKTVEIQISRFELVCVLGVLSDAKGGSNEHPQR